MPHPIIRGSKSAIRQRTRIAYDPAQGITTTEEWESAGDNLGGTAADYQNRGVAYDWTKSSVRSRLVATISRNNFLEEQAVERWELVSNQNQLDVREHPNVVALGQTTLAETLRAVKNHEAGRTVDTSGFSTDQLRLFNLLIRGSTHYMVSQWVLRYTANVSNAFSESLTVADDGLFTLYTTASAVASVPGGRIRSILMSISAPEGLSSDLFWGWLKIASSHVYTANNRVDVSAEYWLAQWPLLLYS